MDLATRMPGGYQAVVPPEVPRGDGFHVAVLHRSAAGFTPELPIIPSDEEDLQRGTRPMVPVHFQLPGHLLRFVACHWTAFDNSTSEIARQRLADVLKRDCRRFLVADIPKPGQTRHVVILGDLNEEPHDEVLRTRLIGCRDRESSRSRTRWQDEDVQRVRLYNAAWRLLGEQVPHGQPVQRLGAAGTLYNDSNDVDKKGWRTFDHLLVSGSLLGTAPPFLDETETRIVTTPAMRDDDGLPTPFKPGSRSGVSDHLPISGRIVLGRT